MGGAGILTYPAVGINSHGLAVTTTGFWTEKDPTRIDRVEEADIFLNVRVLLSSCRTAAQAVEFCRTAPRMNGLNVIAADPTEAYVIEMTSDEIYVEKDEGRGVLFRTNHVVSDQLSHFNPPEENYPSTHKRYDRIAQMVEERYGSLRFQDLYRIMSDHTNEPNCICRHPHEGVPCHHRFHHPLRGRGPRGVDYAAKSLSGPAPCPDRRALCTVSPLCQVLAPVRTVPSLYWFPISKNGQQKFC